MYYTSDNNRNFSYVDDRGIHQSQKDNVVAQTIVGNVGYAYTDQNIVDAQIFFDNINSPSSNKDGNNSGEDQSKDEIMVLYQYEEEFKIMKYYFDDSVQTNKSNVLSIWAFEDSRTIRMACTVFSREFPEWDILLEFGKEEGNSNLEHDDIIKNLNTKLLAGEAPDVLFLDGLSIEDLISKDMLSELTLDIDPSQFYENILYSYTEDDVTYAYPTFFQIPVIVSGKAEQEETELIEVNNLEGIAKLYENPKVIYNDWSIDLFDSLYYAFYAQMFPDNQGVEEEAVEQFLIQTKKMVQEQEMENHSDVIYGATRNNSILMVKNRPSLIKFSLEDTTKATGILSDLQVAKGLFTSKEEVEILPLLGGDYLSTLISSIPKDAKNKEMATKFIEILLTNDMVQLSNQESGFSIKKNIEMEQIQKSGYADDYFGLPVKHLEEFYEYDWEGLINTLNNPYLGELMIYETVYEQASKVYEDKITVEEGVKEIANQLNMLFAERK